MAESPGSASARPELPLTITGPRSSWNKTQAAAAYINRGGAAAAPIASASASRGALRCRQQEKPAPAARKVAAEPPGPAGEKVEDGLRLDDPGCQACGLDESQLLDNCSRLGKHRLIVSVLYALIEIVFLLRTGYF